MTRCACLYFTGPLGPTGDQGPTGPQGLTGAPGIDGGAVSVYLSLSSPNPYSVNNTLNRLSFDTILASKNLIFDKSIKDRLKISQSGVYRIFFSVNIYTKLVQTFSVYLSSPTVPLLESVSLCNVTGANYVYISKEIILSLSKNDFIFLILKINSSDLPLEDTSITNCSLNIMKID